MTLSTELKTIMSVERDGKEKFVVIPTMFEGKFFEPDEAMRRVEEAGFVDPETGREIIFHSTLKKAEAEAKKLGARLDKDPKIEKAFKLLREGQR